MTATANTRIKYRIEFSDRHEWNFDTIEKVKPAIKELKLNHDKVKIMQITEFLNDQGVILNDSFRELDEKEL